MEEEWYRTTKKSSRASIRWLAVIVGKGIVEMGQKFHSVSFFMDC